MPTDWSDADPFAFLAGVTPALRRRDAHRLVELFERVTGLSPRMFGSSVVGFGEYRYEYASGRRGHGPAASFAARTSASVVYLPDGLGAYADLLERLGPHRAGVGCLYITDLDRVDLDVLEAILRRSVTTVTAGTFGHRARES